MLIKTQIDFKSSSVPFQQLFLCTISWTRQMCLLKTRSWRMPKHILNFKHVDTLMESRLFVYLKLIRCLSALLRRDEDVQLLQNSCSKDFWRNSTGTGGTGCTKAPYRSWHIQERVPVETTNKIWYPVWALSNQTWSIRHPSCHSWASLEHLCCWWALTCPGFWPKVSPEGAESLTHPQPGCLCLHRALPPTASCCCSSWLLGQNSARSDLAVSELRKGSLLLLVSIQLLLVIPYFIGI